MSSSCAPVKKETARQAFREALKGERGAKGLFRGFDLRTRAVHAVQHSTYYTESVRSAHCTNGLILMRRPHTARTTFISSPGKTRKQCPDASHRRAEAGRLGRQQTRAPPPSDAENAPARPAARLKRQGPRPERKPGALRSSLKEEIDERGLLLAGGTRSAGSLRSAGGSGRLRGAGSAGHARGAGGAGEAGGGARLGAAVRARVKVRRDLRAALGALHGAARINSCWSEAHEEILSLLR